MLTNSQKPRHQYLRKIMLLPMAAVLTGLFAFSYHQKDEPAKAKPIVVVIDAGHGGSETGVTSGSIKESDLNLQLAKWVQSLNEDPSIQVILTRKSDVTLSLQDRNQLCKQMRADLFISLHVNSAGSANSNGIEVYTASKVVTENSRILASTLINSLKEIYGTTPLIKQRKEEIYVLDKSPCPSALIECGFITNPDDLAFISDPVNQQKIAKSILQAIHEFSLQKIAEKSNSKTINYPDTLMWVKSGAAEKPTTKALVVIDGKLIGYLNDMKNMNDMVNTNDLESVTVLKGDSAIKKYGDKGKNGVIEMITKEKKTGVNDPGVISKVVEGPESKLFTKVEEEAAFPGGKVKWNQYLDKILDKQIPVKQGAPEGHYTAVIQFVVDTDGNISDVRPLSNMGYGMEEEAMRVIKKGPKWIPALQNGKVVKAYRKQKVDFFVPVKNETSYFQRTEEVKPDKYPSFPGGDENWKKYLQQSLNADVAIYKETTNFLIWVQFDVEKDGSLYNLKTLRQYGMGLESEAIRILLAGPKWIPAMKNGKTVATHWSQSFKIRSTKANEEKGYGYLYNSNYKPTISIRKLNSVEPFMLLQVDKETEILNYSISIGTDDKKEKYFYNSGNQFNEETKKMLSELTPGKTFIIESIRISSGGVTKKLPANVFTVTD